MPTGVSGCYAIFFASFRTKFYIGSSKCIRTRLHTHRRKLEKGTHKNRILQSLYRKYPNECRFSVMFEGSEKASRDFEQLTIDFRMEDLYNLDKQVYSYRRKK